MKIANLKTNHLTNPLGYRLDPLRLTWDVTDTEAETDDYTQVRIYEEDAPDQAVYDTGKMSSYGRTYLDAGWQPKPAVRYYWQVEIGTDNGETAVSEPAWFESAHGELEWRAQWISPVCEQEKMPCLYHTYEVKKKVRCARLYCYAVGIYECYLDGQKAGGEYLLPGYHSYDLTQEYQTFDLTKENSVGAHTLAFILGEGWYKGRFVFDGGYENLYGDRKMLIAMLHLNYEDGSEEWIGSGSPWKCVQTPILRNNIYDGETIDRTKECEALGVEELPVTKERLVPRSNLPLRKVERYPVKEVIRTPKGETILDFGEAVTGWVELFADGMQDITLAYGEWMQDGELYRENLRTAKASFSFKGEAQSEWIRPHFTYFGFRYVRVEGMKEIVPEHFAAYRLMSDLEQSGSITTSRTDVNTLIENTVRSQKCNFVDMPLDCPQRDERMGWTGDIAVYARTASYHMDTAAFLHHYMKNLALEQTLLDGAVPFFVPKPKPAPHEGINPFLVTAGACAWGDAATILPWELYLHGRDIHMLKEHYPAMCGWTAYIEKRASGNANPFLWQNDRQLGDWLALDNGDCPSGKTDTGLIASAYFYYSARLCQKAAGVLHKEEDAEHFAELCRQIKEAFIEEYLNARGELTCEKTQTAYALILYLGLYRKEQEACLKDGMRSALAAYGNHLSTGFVGTGMLLQALALHGMAKEAYDLLLQEDYPGWLREVRLGATSIWERWNSLDDNGRFSTTGMNSLNHYAYGCVAGWMYEFMCGFRWDEKDEFYLEPVVDPRFRFVEGSCKTAQGRYTLRWEYQKDGQFCIRVSVPFQAKVRIVLPDGEQKSLRTGTYCFFCADQKRENAG
ncbi:MAG: glycoside hydrolase family 78 protein [bacterium]|nr:glycoside hydrolase family 78 protein [bacterium]